MKPARRAAPTVADREAMVLLSGGLDSAVALYMARAQGFGMHALSFDYGQRHSFELEMARETAAAAGCASHVILKLDPLLFQGTALVGSQIDVPKNQPLDHHDTIPITYVPARNALFLVHTLAYGESRGITDVFIGANVLDYSGYPDCRPEFFSAFETMAALGTKAGVTGKRFQVHTPLIKMSKAEIVREGARLGVDFARTSSCYDPGPDGAPCGTCDSCRLRSRGFAEAGLPDPALKRR
ncbi:MAG: 7-cyano-7-deazaguanine synthase QueC [Spirochaetia bacterium]|nr:7-cyano-7-deazaguanine synthase QueC [Spirochaetia bacterium]